MRPDRREIDDEAFHTFNTQSRHFRVTLRIGRVGARWLSVSVLPADVKDRFGPWRYLEGMMVLRLIRIEREAKGPP